MLVRDITDLRRRDLAILSKDATIREIHHRVKNNLQTVAALLRLQARRTAIPEARQALAESVRRGELDRARPRRSGSVSELVDLDELVDTVLPAIGDGATAGVAGKVRREGSFGTLPAALATPLVLVLTELVHNALAHAFEPGTTGEVCVRRSVRRPARRRGGRRRHGNADRLRSRALRGLGLQIVRTLLVSELVVSAGPPTAGGRDGGRHQPPVEGPLTLHVTVDTVPRSRRRGVHRSPRPERRSHPDRGRRPRARSRVVSGSRARGGGVSGCCFLFVPFRQAVCARVRVAPLQGPPLVLAHAAPDARVLAAPSAHVRHSLTTGQRRQTDLASAICSRAGPLVPTGKNSSGSSSRQIAR